MNSVKDKLADEDELLEDEDSFPCIKGSLIISAHLSMKMILVDFGNFN